MKKLLGIMFMAVLLSGVALIFGCGDDAPTKPAGDVDDPQFQFMDEFLGMSMEGVSMASLDIALDLADSITEMGGTGKPRFKTHKVGQSGGDITAMNYTYSNFWHIFTLEARSEGDSDVDSIIIMGYDSLRILTNGTPTQYPSATTDELQIRQHHGVYAYKDEEQFADAMHHALFDVTADNFASEVITLNGDAYDTLNVDFNDADTIICDISVAGIFGFNNVVFDGGMECPSSGSADATIAVDMECGTGGEDFVIDSAWTADWSFDGGEITTKLETGDTRWQYTDDCGDI